MYEPYEEKKNSRVKEFLQRLKDRIQKPSRNFSFGGFRERKYSIILLIVAILVIGGGLSYTGYTTYTAKVSETQSQLAIQERQLNALKEELNGYKTNLAVCNTDLKNREDSLSKAESNLEENENRLTMCTSEVTRLANSSVAIQTAYIELQNKHSELQTNYKIIECKYVEDNGCDYYTLSTSKVQCCGRIDDKFYCGQQFVPTEPNNVKRFSEYCQS